MLVWNVTGVPSGTTRRLSVTARPGLALGAGTATSDIAIGGGISTPIPVTITVVEPVEPGSTEGTASPVVGDTLYLSYIPTGTDVDLFEFTPAAGTQVGVRLSHLAGDGDLVLYGPPTDTAGTGPSPLGDRADTPDQLPVDEDPGSEIQNDIPLLPGQDVRGHVGHRRSRRRVRRGARRRPRAGERVPGRELVAAVRAARPRDRHRSAPGVCGLHPLGRRARRPARPVDVARRPRDDRARQRATPRRHVRRARAPRHCSTSSTSSSSARVSPAP